MYTINDIHKRLHDIINNNAPEQLFFLLDEFRKEIVLYERMIIYKEIELLHKQANIIKELLFRI